METEHCLVLGTSDTAVGQEMATALRKLGVAAACMTVMLQQMEPSNIEMLRPSDLNIELPKHLTRKGHERNGKRKRNPDRWR